MYWLVLFTNRGETRTYEAPIRYFIVPRPDGLLAIYAARSPDHILHRLGHFGFGNQWNLQRGVEPQVTEVPELALRGHPLYRAFLRRDKALALDGTQPFGKFDMGEYKN